MSVVNSIHLISHTVPVPSVNNVICGGENIVTYLRYDILRDHRIVICNDIETDGNTFSLTSLSEKSVVAFVASCLFHSAFLQVMPDRGKTTWSTKCDELGRFCSCGRSYGVCCVVRIWNESNVIWVRSDIRTARGRRGKQMAVVFIQP